MAKAWNYEGEAALRANRKVDYTIVRPGVMTEDVTEAGYALRPQGAKMKVTKISYDAVAELLVTCSDFPNTRRATLTAMAGDAASWRDLLGQSAGNDKRQRRRKKKQKITVEPVGPDARRFPPSLINESLFAVRAAGVTLLVLFGFGLRALVLFALAFLSASVSSVSS